MNVFTGCLSWVRQLFNDCCSLCCKESFHFQNIRITASAGSGEFKTPSEYSASLLFPKVSRSSLYRSDPVLEILSSTDPVNGK